MKNDIKPPLGVLPELFFLEGRVNEIQRAITSYTEMKVTIPKKWLKEYNRTIKRIQKIREK